MIEKDIPGKLNEMAEITTWISDKVEINAKTT